MEDMDLRRSKCKMKVYSGLHPIVSNEIHYVSSSKSTIKVNVTNIKCKY